MRKIKFTNGEFYHIYNRGVEKRKIFIENYDSNRFIESMVLFNSILPIQSIYVQSFLDVDRKKRSDPLINLICYCLNPNHYHLLIEQLVDGGISEFIKRLGGGYTNFFNSKYHRSGVLFQGKFKATHVDSNEYFLRLSAYVNLNYKVHKLSDAVSKSSWKEYVDSSKTQSICKKNIILSQFNDRKEYDIFAREALDDILVNKQKRKEIEQILFE